MPGLTRTPNGRRLLFALCTSWLVAAPGCSKKMDGPAPALRSSGLPITPAIVCGDQLTTELQIDGARLSPVPVDIPSAPAIALPSLTLTRQSALDGAEAEALSVRYSGDPTAPSNTPLLRWSSQAQMSFVIDQKLQLPSGMGRLASGVYDAQVQNPNGKQAHASGAVAVVDRPTLSGTTPALLCLSQSERELGLSGLSLLRIGDARPQLHVSDVTEPFTVSSLEDCAQIAQRASDAELCRSGRLTLARDSIAPGLHELTLNNPETAACHSEETVRLRVVGAPTISAVQPDVACSLDGKQRVGIRGSGFLQVDDRKPTVRLAGMELPVSGLSDCQTLETPGLSVQQCDQIDLELDAGSLMLGDVAIEVDNPEPAGCRATASGVFRIAGPPMISSVAPTDLCADVSTTFTVKGSGFDRAATASVDGVQASKVTFVSEAELQVSLPGLSTGMHAFTVRNVGSCTATLPAALTVDPSPIVFFADPPVLYAGMPVEITIFTSGLSATATKVELVQGSTRRSVGFASPQSPNKLLAQVPAGLATGAWDVVVTNVGGCPGTLAGGITVTDTLSAALLGAIQPSYASNIEDTAVTVTGSGLIAVPRVYLSASGSTGSARALRAVAVSAAGDSLSAVIPKGLTPGKYDLIVVNPDGKVDVLDQGLSIVSEPPPVITAVAPASLPANASGRTIAISGVHFKPGLSVELDCKTPGGTRTTVPTTEQAPSGDGTSVSVSVTMSQATPSPDAGSVCLVRLINSDGAFFEYSAFSVTNSSLNLSPWSTAPDLLSPRRALALVAGRPTATSRYLYAIGGDNGTNASAVTRGSSLFDSVEASRVDVFGVPASFGLLTNRLPAPRTAAGAASIGKFVYLMGGHDGSAAQSSVYRAAILDPLAGPEIEDIDAALGDGQTGLGKGLYYYRVAALKRASDLDNPGGETLAGELLPIQLPERSEKIALTLKWAAVSGAHGYRVYRSPQPNAAADALQLLAEITCGGADEVCNCGSDPSRCRYQDSGAATQGGKSPLPDGSLGVWHAPSGARCTSGDCLLGSAREGLSVTAVADPSDASKVYLYAFGGRNQAGAYLDTYEVATVTIASDGAQTMSDFVQGGDTLAVPRADLGVWVMSRTNSNVIASSGTPNAVWLYVGGGRTTGGTTNKTLEAGLLGSNGQLGNFVATDDLNGSLVGFGTGASNDQLYTFGGVSGTSDGTSAQLCDGTGGCGPLPDLKPGAFNALGAATTQRMFAGSTQESAFFFVAGGHDGTSTLKTTQRTVQ